ncbi:hypothetical protein [Nocardia tengchongensis]|uniref:hypothetical protein n=1 Tax=Nocardia tengchongensis TaxID=2055889 RepID=UPI0036493CE5
MPQTPRGSAPLSSIHVRWSQAESAYLAWSEDHPGYTRTNPWSSLAAVDELLDAITE